MTMNIDKDTVMVLGSGAMICGTIIAVVVAACKSSEKEKANQVKIDNVIHNLSNLTEVQVEDFIVEKAAEKAALRACESAAQSICKKYDNSISEAANKAYKEMESEVSAKIQIAIDDKLDVDQVITSVEDKVAKKAYKDVLKKMERYNDTLISSIRLKSLSE